MGANSKSRGQPSLPSTAMPMQASSGEAPEESIGENCIRHIFFCPAVSSALGVTEICSGVAILRIEATKQKLRRWGEKTVSVA